MKGLPRLVVTLFLADKAFCCLALSGVLTGEKEMKNILIFGDSLTAGYGLPAAQAYPSLLQEQLRQEGYTDYKVLNGGLSGDTTAGGVHRIDRWLHEPLDIFILALGANDGLRGIPARETTQNLQEIINKVHHQYPEVNIILSGMEI